MDELTDLGLGLRRHTLRHARTAAAWVSAGAAVCTEVAALLPDETTHVEHVGSTAVVGLLAKPIIDLAVGVDAPIGTTSVAERLTDAGWIERGDGGDDGGHLFVLESGPDVRVAHLHVVVRSGRQWDAYLRFRELLRSDATARAEYEALKLHLADTVGDDRVAYTDGKSELIRRLLG